MAEESVQEPQILPVETPKVGLVQSTLSLPYGKVLLAAGVVAIVAIAGIPSLYFYNKYDQTQKLLKSPTQAAQMELDDTIKLVGKLLSLPAKERPTLATVSDVSKLKAQPFFAHAANGDKVLIYTEAKKAILYRPSSNLIIEVAPLSVNQEPAEVAGAATSSATADAVKPSAKAIPSVTITPKPIRIAIYNGTTKTGLAGTIEQILKLKIPNLQVVEKGNAKGQAYDKSVIIDVKGNARSAAEQMASIIGGEVSPLPVGETLPDADFLIIAGQK